MSAADAPSAPQARTAALLERAYRMALLLRSRLAAPGSHAAADEAADFECLAVASELLDLIDEVRAGLLGRGPG